MANEEREKDEIKRVTQENDMRMRNLGLVVVLFVIDRAWRYHTSSVLDELADMCKADSQDRLSRP
jgi:hypothetical protein